MTATPKLKGALLDQRKIRNRMGVVAEESGRLARTIGATLNRGLLQPDYSSLMTMREMLIENLSSTSAAINSLNEALRRTDEEVEYSAETYTRTVNRIEKWERLHLLP